MRHGRSTRRLLAWLPAVSLTFILLVPAVAAAQVDVTPNFSVTPSRDTGGWTYWMARGAIVLGVLLLLALVAAYLRFAPRFFGRQEPAKLAPGVRPPLLARRSATAAEQAARQPQALASSEQPPSAPARPAAAQPAAPAAAPVAGPSATSTGTAVAERDDAPPVPAAGEIPPADTETSTQGDRHSAVVTPDDRGEDSGPATVTVPTDEAQSPAPQPVATASAPAGATAASTASGSPSAAASAGGGSGHGAGLDQETFDRVLQEQLAKGMDRRVAEGRARAAAVVAARKKAQG